MDVIEMVKEECLASTMKETLLVVIDGYITCLKNEVSKLKTGLEKTKDDFRVHEVIKESLKGVIKNMDALVHYHEELKKEVEKIPECEKL